MTLNLVHRDNLSLSLNLNFNLNFIHDILNLDYYSAIMGYSPRANMQQNEGHEEKTQRNRHQRVSRKNEK